MASELISIVENVALHGGAWIETDRQHSQNINFRVALHGGAWIETGEGSLAVHL